MTETGRTIFGNQGRRAFLGLSSLGLALPLGAMARAAWRSDAPASLRSFPICRAAAEIVAPGTTPRKIRLCWSANAVCHTGIAVADLHGYFGRHNLQVERVNVSGAADELLELLASGKADAGLGMALGWLKPLEQGFDVKLTTGVHGGCIRLLTTSQSGITDVAALKGKAVGTLNMASPDRNFVSVLAAKSGLDPLRDIDWRIYPADLLGVALKKGEIQAFSATDPIGAVLRDRDHLVEVTNNLAGEFADRACCVLGIRGGLVRDERSVAAALTVAVMEAQEWVADNPDAAGAVYASYSKMANAEQVSAMLRTHTHHHHPSDGALRQEIMLYATELKQAGVLKRSTDPEQFAEQVCADVLPT